jgi:hypothetical protein
LKQSLGLAIPGERFGGIFIGRGSRPSGVLMTPDGMKLSKEAKENLRRSWSEATSGLRALSVALLEEGIKFNPITVNPRRPVHPDPPVSGRRHRQSIPGGAAHDRAAGTGHAFEHRAAVARIHHLHDASVGDLS